MNKIIRFIRKISWWQYVLILLLGASIFYGYLFVSRSGFSASSIVVSVEGPESFKAREKTEFEIKFDNKSGFDLRNIFLYVTLPEFLSFENGEKGERRIDLEEVKSKKEILTSITVFANETQKEGEIKVRAEYMPGNLSGTFEAKSRAKVSIASLPLTVIFDIPQNAVNGQRLRGSFHFVAESELESLPLVARMILPEGFILKDAEPKPKSTTTWEFKKVEAKKSYQVEFEGVISGYKDEVKSFDLLFGGINAETGFLEQFKTSREVRMSSAPLEFSQTVNGSASSPQASSEEYIVSPGEQLKFKINYENKSGVDIEDVSITTVLSGDEFDFSTLDTGAGYFNSSTKTIIWNKDFVSNLSRLGKEEKGSVDFSISLKEDISSKSYKDKNISLKSSAVIDSSDIPLSLKGLSLRAESIASVKLRTSIDLSNKAYYYQGPISNLGPIPPSVGEKTTYTISWQIKNSFNEMSDVVIEAPLPKYAVFEEKTYPFSNKLSYDSDTHSVSWDIDGLSWGVGYVFPTESVSFQISVTPQEEMRGQVIDLVERAKISGQDVFTGEFLESFSSSINTTLPDDAGIREGDGVVR